MNKELSFLAKDDVKKVCSVVVEELKNYKALKVRLQNKKEQCEKGIEGDLFPKLIDNEQRNELKVIQIDRALENSLDDTERKIIEMKYLSKERQNDLNIYLELGIQKTPYYELKKTAIIKIAISLGII
ncbi:ArpU family phage packaging/lysis transcriptional regulator [Schinkia azotoformans]|uniref:ArpU family phage packaging/lysis transcriptional regulator n=1 Tax=Schinkia azotoformans TaxID=1454 RepID=UPI002DBD8193|nr:ArpU family phage packaging/lysis transcriptional regulator [Schinkia azotoformans]MEC1723923.1 ArpU family phage packaging/lysis transcriptional regulator [Schinkia azotoformans]